MLFDRLGQYALLMRMDKPIGTLLLLWPTVWALWLAARVPTGTGEWLDHGVNQPVVLVFLVGVFLMRSAGCVINDYADRDIDKHVERTHQRPLTSGRISSFEALALFCALALMAFALLFLLPIEVRLPVILLSVPAILLTISYPFTKRFLPTPQLILGLAFSFSIPMAFVAHGHTLNIGVLLLMLANVCWVIAYDTQYAMVDREDDAKLGIQSTALLFGRLDRHIIACLQIATITLLALVGWYFKLGLYYGLVLAFSAGYFVYQQMLIYARQRQQCFQAFLNNSWFGAMIFIGILLAA